LGAPARVVCGVERASTAAHGKRKQQQPPGAPNGHSGYFNTCVRRAARAREICVLSRGLNNLCRSLRTSDVPKRLFDFWFALLPTLLLLLGCGSPSTPASAADASGAKVLHLGSTSWVPFTAEQGQPRVASYVVERALERAGYKTDTTIVADGALTPALREGRFDGSDALWESDDRQEFLVYSDPYLENRLLLVGRKGTDVSATSFAALAGKKIAIVEGYAYGRELESAKEPVFVRVKSAQENLRAVLSGQVDYCLLDALVVEFLFEQHPKRAREELEVGREPLIRRSLHFALRKSVPDAAEIIKRFNAVVGDMVRDGTYNLALQVTWITADVDGDGRAELVRGGDRVGTAPPERSYQLFRGSTEKSTTSGAPGVMTPEQQHRYYVNGHTYNSWEEIPDNLKLQPDANTVGAGHPQMNLIEW
jgi:polar amino acid transport system substrate-binding protein